MTTADTSPPATTLLLFAVPTEEQGTHIIAVPLSAPTLALVRAATACTALAGDAGVDTGVPLAVPVDRIPWRKADVHTFSDAVADPNNAALSDISDGDDAQLLLFAAAARDHSEAPAVRLNLSVARCSAVPEALGFRDPADGENAESSTALYFVVEGNALGLQLRTTHETKVGPLVEMNSSHGSLPLSALPEFRQAPAPVTRSRAEPAATLPRTIDDTTRR